MPSPGCCLSCVSMQSPQPSIEVTDLHKGFLIPRAEHRSIRHPAGLVRTSKRRLDVLDGITFTVPRGGYFGIAGRNGSGKSTLLKVLGGIYPPDQGTVRVEGRIGPVLDLGVGFNPELPARDNAVINGIMLGLSRKQARQSVNRILDFAELEEFAEAQLKNLSSGMRMRLAFATMLETNPDVLLVDEVLAVGDQRFQERCTAAMEDVRRRGKTIVLVSHSMPTVERLCDRAMLLEEGKIDRIGDPSEIAARYMEINATATPESSRDAPGLALPISPLSLGGDAGGRATIGSGETIELRAELELDQTLLRPLVRIEIRNARGARIFVSPETPLLDSFSDRLQLADGCVVEARIENRLVPGEYVAVMTILREGRHGRSILAFKPISLGFNVAGQAMRPAGLVTLNHEVAVRTAAVDGRR